jgi:hypothetical protein
MWRRALAALSAACGIQGLQGWKDKFGPRWAYEFRDIIIAVGTAMADGTHEPVKCLLESDSAFVNRPEVAKLLKLFGGRIV